MEESIRYTPRHVLRPLANPREVTVTITRKTCGAWHTTMPVKDLDYLIALAWQEHTNLPGLDVRKLRMDRIRSKTKPQPKSGKKLK